MSRPPMPRLHVLTDARADVDPLPLVDAALDGGADAIQVRRKDVDDRDLLALARAVAARCRAAGAICLVNDRVDIALAADAHGVHLGADDLPVAAARRIAGDRLIVGGTARDPARAAELVADGADYLGVGPVFATSTKDGLPDPIGLETLAAVVAAVSTPIVAISGITLERMAAVVATGAHGVAVTGAVSGADDPAAATRALWEALGRPASGVG